MSKREKLSRIKSKVLGSDSASSDDNIVTTMYHVMKEFGYTETKNMALPSFLIICEEMKKEVKDQQKAMKKTGKR